MGTKKEKVREKEYKGGRKKNIRKRQVCKAEHSALWCAGVRWPR